MIKAIFFDCFGVLMLTPQESLEARYPEQADRLTELSHQADLGFLDRAELVAQIAELISLSPRETDKILADGYVANERLTDYIGTLKKQGYTIGLISNLGRGWFESYVPESAKLLFDDRVVSGEVGMVKPYPEIFELACSRLNVLPEQSVFVDDLISNCDGALQVGMKAIHYTAFKRFQQELATILKASDI